jgi:hypothetical protein
MDIRTEELLRDYRRSVEKIARGAYLQAIALRHEVENNGLNVEDQQRILLHCIGLLTGHDPKKKSPDGKEPRS